MANYLTHQQPINSVLAIFLITLAVSLIIHGHQAPRSFANPDTITAHAATSLSDLTLAITDDREFVRPGDEVTVRTSIRSQRPETTEPLKVVVHIPDYLVPKETSPAALADPNNRTITWENVAVAANQETQLSIRATIATQTPLETQLTTTVEMTGQNIRVRATDTTAVKNVRVVGEAARTIAPQPSPSPASITPTATTGGGTGIIFSGLALVGSSALTTLIRNKVSTR